MMNYLCRLPNLGMLALIYGTVRLAVLQPFYQQIGQPFVYGYGAFILLACCVICIAAAGYVVNNIYDVQTDHINRPGKNPIGHTIAPATAWMLYALLNGAAIAGTAYFMNGRLWAIHLSAIAALWAYSFWLKRQALVGNLLVAALAAISVTEAWLADLPILYQQAATGNNSAVATLYLLMLYVGFAFLTTLLRELIKDIEDMEGDRQSGGQTLPIIWGKPRTMSLCLGIVAALVMALWMQTQMLWKAGFIVVAAYSVIALILPLFYLLYRLRHARQKADFSRLSRLLKGYMLAGLLLLWVWRWGV